MMCAKVREQITKFKTEKVKIFIATDSEPFLKAMKTSFGKKVFFFDMKRSQNDCPIHTDTLIDGYTKGKMALFDCLALSKCDLLIRTSSNLSNVSMLLNPTLPVVRVNNAYWRAHDR